MASEIRVDKINSLSGVGTVTLSPTGVDISGITTVQTLKVGTGLTASEDGDIFFTGVCTATTFAGSGANLTALPAAQLSGTLPALSAANLTSIPAANVTGTLPAISGANLTSLTAANLTGTLPALSAASLTSIPAANIVGVCTSGLTKTGGFGKIIQVQSANFSSQFAYNSSSGTDFTASNITVNITPTSASSKILVTASFNVWKSGSSAQVNNTIYRDSTNLGDNFYGFGEFGLNAAYATQWNLKINDSPNTTSQVTYTVYTRVQSGHNLNIGANNVPTNITAVEYST